MTVTGEEVPLEEAISNVAEGMHTGLRKGTDAEDSHDLWLAISRSDTSAWSDAARFLVQGLEIMGIKLVRVVKDDDA